MVETLINILLGLSIVILGWLIFLTIKIRTVYKKANQLFSSKKQGSLSGIIEKYLSDVKNVEDHCFKLDNEAKKILKMAESSIQKTGYVRYNPFGNAGGDQSFSLALLDSKENGLVLSSIHSREGTRVYFKPINTSKSDYNLSEEEHKAIEIAQKK